MTDTGVGTDRRLEREVAAGTSIAASLLLLTVGALSLLEGVSAVGRDEIFVPGPDHVYGWDRTEWGRLHTSMSADRSLPC
ncbi:DUF7144 family membrane protein [Nocardia jiangsuensis]|uniref:DUF7144 domain-containing protein n=1 Tax=Nocardia jiangsuensis TaxID=1691563 RepID=A0ABV8E160_9NOCA